MAKRYTPEERSEAVKPREKRSGKLRYNSKSKEIDWKGELRIYERRPRAIERASYLQALPEAVKEYLLAAELKERPERVRAVLELLEFQLVLLAGVGALEDV